MNNGKIFTVQEGTKCGTYGPRVWVHYGHYRDNIGKTLANLSMWKGTDKRAGEWIAFEFQQDRIGQVMEFLKTEGFEAVKFNPYDPTS